MGILLTYQHSLNHPVTNEGHWDLKILHNGGLKKFKYYGQVRHNGGIDLKVVGGGGRGGGGGGAFGFWLNVSKILSKCIPELAQDTFSFTFPCLLFQLFFEFQTKKNNLDIGQKPHWMSLFFFALKKSVFVNVF